MRNRGDAYHVSTRFNRFVAFQNRCFFLRILQYRHANLL